MNGPVAAKAVESLREYEASEGASTALANALRQILESVREIGTLAQRACVAAESTANAMTSLHSEFDELRGEVRAVGDAATAAGDASTRALAEVQAAVEYVRAHTRAVRSEAPSSPELHVARNIIDLETDPDGS